MAGIGYEATLERRERILELHKAGRVGWQIAFDLNINVRTVQRHLAAIRAGKPVGTPGPAKGCRPAPKPHRHELVWARREKVAQLSAQGLTRPQIAQLLNIFPRAARRDRYEYNRRMRQG